MKQLLLVFIGGGIGSCLRFLISRNFNAYYDNFFVGTFVVNIIGSLIIGFVLGCSLKGNYFSKDQILFLATGFCGGFTTFSAFAFEKHGLLQSGELLYFTIYALSSIFVGVLAIAFGLWLSRLI
ncbi:fluoride efflux transporter CrcB [Eudoraea chungangensis]|uniref:fluoride efflux transporter CrcB n=1 Tax=Eudoraea chungangensis TaxID=1481905 RepID=UPI0023ED20A9|nr:fluoride efflux transporter CrcB [Eudoraea chungangensis]